MRKSIVIYFSRADENYFDGEMKYIDKGNTEIIAEYIKDLTGADLFKVEPLNPYSEKYMECIEEAKVRTREHNAPIKESIKDISQYEIIYIGSPIYWGGMPEEMFTALKPLDFKGKIIKPFTLEEVSVVKGFYEKDAESKTQEQALIYYENTYMPNTGVLYGAKNSFDVISVADGTVESIVADELIGNIITIKHTNNLISRYESINEVNVMVGDALKKGDVIGTAGENKIDSTYDYMLLFEVEHNGTFVNPENIFGMNVKELS